MSDDKHARIVVTTAVTSSMVAASTGVFAWTFTRFVETEGYRYCFPLVIYGTVWVLVSVFAAGVAWFLAEQVGAWMAQPRPPRPPGPNRPPDQPGETPRQPPAPINPPRPHPPRKSEVTLVDMAPISDETMEIPKVGGVRTGYRIPRHVPTYGDDWRPPVSNSMKERV